jgi:C4-dicarboxylate transporter DctM subunit
MERRNYASGNRATMGERLNALKHASWALFMPVIVLGGIYSGLFTPTEAAAVSVMYGFVIGALRAS